MMRALAIAALVLAIGCSGTTNNNGDGGGAGGGAAGGGGGGGAGGGGGGGGGSGAGLFIETLAGTPPTLNAVFTIDGNIAYAVGGSDGVWRRDGHAWTQVAGPVSVDTAMLDGVWAAADDDVYVTTSYGGTTVYHSTDRGSTWTSLASLSTNPMSIAGTDASHVYVAGIEGDIAVGSAAGAWSIDRPADQTQWTQIVNGQGTMLAVRESSVWVLDTTWTQLFDIGSAGGVLWGTWGTSRDDVYGVGTNAQCPMGTCGTIYHSVHGGVPTLHKVADAFMAIYGSSSGTIYAVGSGGSIATSTGNDGWAVTTPVSVLLNAVHAANGHVYAVGMAGTIVHIVE